MSSLSSSPLSPSLFAEQKCVRLLSHRLVCDRNKPSTSPGSLVAITTRACEVEGPADDSGEGDATGLFLNQIKEEPRKVRPPVRLWKRGGTVASLSEGSQGAQPCFCFAPLSSLSDLKGLNPFLSLYPPIFFFPPLPVFQLINMF